jgi:hypothetical protein
MKWFRSNIRHGSRLALFALAIQFALSFGHFHGAAASAAPALQAGAIVLEQSALPQQPAPDRDTDKQHPADPCAICAGMALASTALFATPPLLPLRQMVELACLTADAGFLHLNSVRVAFQPRAPPVS